MLTTAVNFVFYFLFYRCFKWELNLSNFLAIALSIVFAYFTNRSFVFGSKVRGIKAVLLEAFYFFSSRAAVSLLDIGIVFLFAGKLGYNEEIIKLSAMILVIALNYILSKFFIFKKKGND